MPEPASQTHPLAFVRRPEAEIVARATAFADELRQRRSVRDFSSEPIPRAALEQALLAAGSAPNGANMQPWRFVVVTSPELKAQIRAAAEAEEQAFYGGRASEEWLAALAPLGTDADKPFLEQAPALIVIFREDWGQGPGGERVKHYYVRESVGIATGMLIAALHHAGLATLTHTPSPMGFLRELLGRPANERAEMILVVGFPAEGARVPRITKKPLTETTTWL